MRILSGRHITTYRYKQPVGFGEHRMMLYPREDHDQRLIELDLEITPRPSLLRRCRDVFGNQIAIAHFTGRAEVLRFESSFLLEHSPAEFFDADIEDCARNCPFAYHTEDMPHLLPFTEGHCADAEHMLARWVQDFLRSSGLTGTRAVLEGLTRSIHKTFAYKARHEKGIQDPLVTLKSGSGSCRDLAVFMLEAVRSLGIAARFVSGYLHLRAHADGHNRGGNTHAWVQLYVPGSGWVDFDPSRGVCGNRDLVRVAVARAPSQAIPLAGVWIGCPSDNLGMTVEVHITETENEVRHSAAHVAR
jgi:transglutaminase-like putative cysteine protease